MKRIYLILSVIILVFTISCSKSDNNDSSKLISAKIEGTLKYFNNISVAQDINPDYIDYIITAKQSDDNSKTLTISMEKEATGTESIYYIQYFDSENYYDGAIQDISTNITENSSSKVKGTFSGNLNDGEGTIVQITQGIIDINL